MIELVAAALDHSPKECDAAERLILVAIAEETRKRGEPRDIPVEDLMRRTGLSDTGLRRAVSRLATRGLRVRVPYGTDRRGQPLYAVTGRSPRWVFPELAACQGCACQSCRTSVASGKSSQVREGGTGVPPPFGGGTGVPAGGTGVPAGGTGVPPGGTGVPPTPYSVSVSVLSGRSALASSIASKVEAEEEEIKLLIEKIKAMPGVRNVSAYAKSLPAEDLQSMLDEVRGFRRQADHELAWAAYRAQVRVAQECEHGQPGGDIPRPVHGTPACMACRNLSLAGILAGAA